MKPSLRSLTVATALATTAVSSPVNDEIASPGAVKFDFHGLMHVARTRSEKLASDFSTSVGEIFDDIFDGPDDKVKAASRAGSDFLQDNTSVGPEVSAVPSAAPANIVNSNVSLTTGYNFYLTNITVGSPPQDIEVGLDTGSPYLWVFGPETSYNNAPRFFPNQSTTFHSSNQSFTGLYGAGGVFGTWGQDNIGIKGAEVNQFPFGVINQYDLASGVPGLLGVGPNSNLTNETYANLPEALYRQGVTKSPAFSVFLDSGSSDGSVIFGGVDKAKFQEPVYVYDIAKTGSEPTYYYQLALSSLALNNGSSYDVFGPAVLDTGSPFSQLPPGFVNQVGQGLGFTYYDKYQCWYKAANYTGPIPDESITMTFGQFNVEIPIEDLIIPGEYMWAQDGPAGAENVQALGLMGTRSYLIGDHLFKHAYVTFNSLAGKIYLAQAVPSSSSDIVDLVGSDFPGAVAGVNNGSSTDPYQSFTYTTLTPIATPTASTGNSNSIITNSISTMVTSAPLFYSAT
ncbi:Yps3p [Sugiyamaella lignohabitans]|uniref:Yps3p n=1 Tax=Sugiyamaella lignohabitans TaxID=796027 RepID=A0A170R033_9ASCO|nr:Yps3p [Sugiyamaella lignohabitans]ANB16032.1 Yps3p [Sugiyamaella lignohabitans]